MSQWEETQSGMTAEEEKECLEKITMLQMHSLKAFIDDLKDLGDPVSHLLGSYLCVYGAAYASGRLPELHSIVSGFMETLEADHVRIEEWPSEVE